MRLIDADSVIDTIKPMCGVFFEDEFMIDYQRVLSIVTDAPTIRTKEVNYFDEDEKVWKIGEVIVNSSEKPNNSKEMSRADKWNVHIDGILPTKKVCGFTIEWSGNIGFGEYIIYQEDGKWKGYSECMDEGEDKEFLKHLLDEFVKNIEIVG